jgi:hypothetical protein
MAVQHNLEPDQNEAFRQYLQRTAAHPPDPPPKAA